MKRTRFYSALGRVRSNSASRALYTNPPTLPLGSFFDTPPPPPPNTRLTTHRLPIEARGQVEGPNSSSNPHAPLALAAPHAPANQHPHPAQLALLFPYSPGPTPKPAPAPAASGTRAHRRRGPRYTLDVGAYGIPKRGHRVRSLRTHAQQEALTDAPLAVQVGEDAYFVRENAMGVADGVGGWARVKHPAPPTGPSASALFARRLMHFCADEVDRASHSHHLHSHSHHSAHTTPVPVVTPWHPPSSTYTRFAPYPASTASSLPSAGAWRAPTQTAAAPADFAPSSFPSSSSPASFPDPWPWGSPYSEYESDPWADDDYAAWQDEHTSPADLLAAELDELADGLDVLHILERAYERTLSAHVVPVPEPASGKGEVSASSAAVPIPIPIPIPAATGKTSVAPTTMSASAPMTSSAVWPLAREKQAEPQPQPKTIPLLAGSSTALVAVLDYVPAEEVDAALLTDGAVFTCPSATATTPAAASATSSSSSSSSSSTAAPAAKDNAKSAQTQPLTPVLKIAHVGDCMGMLVREGKVAWRSEEMWWRWNTPVQLSAARAAAPTALATGTGTGTGTGTETRAGKAGWWASFVDGAAGPSAPTPTPTTAQVEVTPSSAAHLFTLPVQAGDVVILASDGLSDNLWDEDVLEEVGRVRRAFEADGGCVGVGSREEAGLFELSEEGGIGSAEGGVDGARLRRRTLAGMLSEALCSRARRVATRRAGRESGRPCVVVAGPLSSSLPTSGTRTREAGTEEWAKEEEEEGEDEDDTPFARRAKETGRVYRGGKNDDISVIVAVIAPAEEQQQQQQQQQRGHGHGHGHGRGRVEAARAAGS